MIKQLTMGAVLLVIVIPALAANRTAQSGFYIAASGGSGQIYSPYSYMNNSTGSFDYGAFAWGASAGYQHALNHNFSLGLEVGYNDDGQSKYNGSGGTNDAGSLQISSRNWNVLATANYYWPCGITAFVEAGPAYVMQNANFEAPVTFPNTTISNDFNATTHRVRLLAEWGLGYQITQSLGVYGMGSYLFSEHGNNWKDVNNSGDINSVIFSALTWQLGVNYRFGS